METEARIQAENIRKDKVISDALALEKKKELEAAAKKAEDELLLQTALQNAEMVAKEVTESALGGVGTGESWGDISDVELVTIIDKEVAQKEKEKSVPFHWMMD